MRRPVNTNTLILLFLFIAPFAIYWKSIGFEFIASWDDYEYVLNNGLIRGFSVGNLRAIFLEPYFSNYAPLHLLSYSIDFAIWGLDPRGYHLSNILLHSINSALAFLALRRLTKSDFLSLAGAALFALHPLNVENVAWVAERKSLLAALFTFCSIIFYADYREKGRTHLYALSLVFLVLALASKAFAVMLPAVFLCYEIFLRDRRRFIHLIPAFVIAGLFALASVHAHSEGSLAKEALSAEFLLGNVYPTMVPVFWKYIKLIILPSGLSGFYDTAAYDSFLDPVVVSAVLAWVAAFAAVMWKGSGLVRFFFLWFWIWLLPSSNILPLNVYYADRYMYLPAIGAFVLFGYALQKALSYVKLQKAALPILGTVALAFAAVTFFRLDVWKNEVAFWEDTAKKTPTQERVFLNLGYAYEMRGRYDDAERAYMESINIYPTQKAMSNLNMIREKKEFMRKRQEIDSGRQ